MGMKKGVYVARSKKTRKSNCVGSVTGKKGGVYVASTIRIISGEYIASPVGMMRVASIASAKKQEPWSKDSAIGMKDLRVYSQFYKNENGDLCSKCSRHEDRCLYSQY
jgi:hypothetical protein